MSNSKVKNNHEPLISRQSFDAVQDEIQRRTKHFGGGKPHRTYPFTKKITCGCCGNTYRKKIASVGTKYKRPVWICTTFNRDGKKHCPKSRQIPEDILLELSSRALGLEEIDPAVFERNIECMIAEPSVILYRFKDGHEIRAGWQNLPSHKNTLCDEIEQTKVRSETYLQQ